MTPKQLFYIAIFSILLSGCGLEEETDYDRTGAFSTPDQNRYLPLTSDTQLVYADTTQGTLTSSIGYDEAFSSQKQIPVYSIDMTGASTQMRLYFSSDSNQIQLLGIDGPFEFTVNSTQYEADYFRFANALQLTGTPQYPDTTASARITESGGADISDQFNIRVSYTLTNTDNRITLTGQGNLPTLQAQLSATIYVDSAQTTPSVTLSQQTVTGTFDFTPGIGIVAHEGIYLDQAFNSTLQSLQSLPNIIWFDYNDGAPIAITSNTTFNTSNGNLSSTDYEIVNQSELDELDWITVNEDVASNTFNVSMQYSSTLPSSLTAVPVLFRNKHTHRVVSGSVILQP
ncbi:hypothetical protein FT643_16095 [Ketobacter sp. MCCC 1A13808]|uniref:hypothetical protein n=1 Tax=Ketobacter sp. MCCC 1A13808 TaxID=2602738 RepID=UPI0012EC584C|nr:hypothetical protein [Ketobacter sp. MCCC 1A13808]MVF13665.1 hypothetical protein [Ketobacter sp. MCCC 1A13808]